MKKAELNELEVIEYYKTHSLAATIKYFKSSDPRILKILNDNNIPRHSPMESRRFTYQEKYGVNEFSETDIFKSKVKQTWENKSEEEIKSTTNKRKETKLIKYGDPNYNNPTGISNTLINKSEEEKQDIKDKRASTILELYGDECFSKTEEFKIRFHNSWDKKSEEELQNRNDKIKNTYLKTIKDKYGVEGGYVMSPKCRYASTSAAKDSKANLEFKKLLEQNGFKVDEIENREFPLGPFKYDFKINNILIEINPTATHNITKSPYKVKELISKEYHYNKTKYALENDYKCIHIFDWTDKNKVISLLSLEFEQIQGNIKRHIITFQGRNHLISETEPLKSNYVEIFDDGSIFIINNKQVTLI